SVVVSRVGYVTERDTDTHPVPDSAPHVEAGAEFDRTAEVDVSIPVIGPNREPGSDPPRRCETQIGSEAGIGEEGLLGGAGNSERRNEREASRLAWSPGARVEPILESESVGGTRVA